ncbi:MAG: hypothetical protein MNPFHGCM_00458 [Gemmatimonadaceae bacterium]|nr:hypothetical protein [Gemmatimonadaceae bacterium]
MPDTTTASALPTAPVAGRSGLVIALAHALHKRAIYPVSHPLLGAAVQRFVSRAIEGLDRDGPIAIGVAHSQLVIDGVAVDGEQRVLSELASHLHAHQLAGLRLLPGATATELEDLVAILATPADRVDKPLGQLSDDELHRWRHVALLRARFERLGLAEDDSPTAGDEGEHPIWLALALSALDQDELPPDADVSTGAMAARMEAQVQSGDATQARRAANALVQLTEGLAQAAKRNALAPAMQQRASDLVQALAPETLRRLLTIIGEDTRARLMTQATDVFNARALIDILAAGAAAGGKLVSDSMIRLFGKLARNSEDRGRHGGRTDAVLRTQVRRQLADWMLDDPNPDRYSELLRDLGQGEAPAIVDGDGEISTIEPERLLEISLEIGALSPSTESAVTLLVERDGLAALLDRLVGYPWSDTREAIIDSLVNGVVLREQLAVERPDMRVLIHAVARLKSRAVDPLLDMLQQRNPEECPWVVDLLVQVGPDALPFLDQRIDSLQPGMQRLLLFVYERLGGWPEKDLLRMLCRHEDASLRREAFRLGVRHASLRNELLVAGARDEDTRILALVIAKAGRACDRRLAAVLMERLEQDERVSDELRARAVRAIATCDGEETLRWLTRRPLTQQWLFRYTKLRKGTLEMYACIAALATRHAHAPSASLALLLARRNRDHGYRRAAAAEPVVG